MSIDALTQIIAELDLCIAWVQTLIPDLKPSWRYFHYREVLSNAVQNSDDGISFRVSSNDLSHLLEAFNSTDNLRNIHRKFKDRSDSVFKIKLREATLGPLYRYQEGKKPKGHYGRDTESELVFAAMFKDQSFVSFSSADFTISTPSFRVGVEVKNLQSPTQVVKNYLKAARQIQANQNVQWGMVMLRLDRLLYFNQRSGILLTKPLLAKRTVAGMKYDQEQKIDEFCFYQAQWFQDEFGTLFLEQTKNHNLMKCLGFGIYINMPFAIGEPPNVRNRGIVKLVRWGSKQPGDERDKAVEEFVGTLEEQSIRTIKKPSSIILLN
jgi:hypothetical protein